MPTIEITTTVGCPLMCTFCPQDVLKNVYGPAREKYLTLDYFKQIVSKLPPYVQIDFSGMAEPWANPAATDMLDYALQCGRRVAIYTTLHGMSAEDAARVVSLIVRHVKQISEVVLHLPDSNMNMRGWRNSDDYRHALEAFLKLKNSSNPAGRKIEAMTMDASGNVHPELRHLALRFAKWEGISRAGSLDAQTAATVGALPTPRNEQAVSCATTPFYDHNVVLPNGDVVLCCMDYSLRHKLGNLIEQEYSDLFLSSELAKLRAENAKPGFSKCSICKSCGNVIKYSVDESRWHTDAGSLGVRTAVSSYLLPSLRTAITRRLKGILFRR